MAAAAAPPWAAGTAAVAEEYIGCFPVSMQTAGATGCHQYSYSATHTRDRGLVVMKRQQAGPANLRHQTFLQTTVGCEMYSCQFGQNMPSIPVERNFAGTAAVAASVPSPRFEHSGTPGRSGHGKCPHRYDGGKVEY